MPTGLLLRIDRLDVGASTIAAWATKREAVTELAGLRDRGLNHVDVQAHRIRLPIALVWGLAHPDDYEGVTYLMTSDGAWLRGRLTDPGPCGGDHGGGRDCSWDRHPVPWQPLTAAVRPAPFTHATSTVPDADNRRERYRTKANGSCGRWITSDDAVARCTCGWRRHAQTRAEARAAARWHREHPDERR